jgi:PBP1b-binding outer membrane lipoprotein LpoB
MVDSVFNETDVRNYNGDVFILRVVADGGVQEE